MYCIYDLLKKHMSTASNVIKYAIFNQWNTLKIKDKCKSDVTLHNLFSNSFRVCKFLWKITLRKEIKIS